MVHHVPLQQRGQDGIPADDPDIFIRPQPRHKLRDVSPHRDEPLLRQAVGMGEDIVFRGGVKTGGVLQLGDLLKGPPAHDSDVHPLIEAVAVRLLRAARLVEPGQPVVLVGQIAVQGDTAVEKYAHGLSFRVCYTISSPSKILGIVVKQRFHLL